MTTINSKYTLIFFDTETTGSEPTDRLIQLAYKKDTDTVEESVSEFFKNPVPITFDAMAVHHITEERVADKPLCMESTLYAGMKDFFEGEHAVGIAHNAKFDVDMMARENITVTQWIDTLKLARFLDPALKLGRHNLQYLRYRLGLYNDITADITPHDALSDVLVLEKLFEYQVTKMKEDLPDISDDELIEKMIDISVKPMLMPKFTFGKHRGKSVQEVAEEDRGYLEWLLREKKNSDEEDVDWVYTLEQFLNP